MKNRYDSLRVPNICSFGPCGKKRLLPEVGLCLAHMRQHLRGERLHMVTTEKSTPRGSKRYKPKKQADGTYRVALVGSDTHVMTVDADALDLLEQVRRWRVVHDSWTSYAVVDRCADKTLPILRMPVHGLLMGEPPKPGLTVDHIDGCGLNNTAANLRWATKTEQNLNRRRRARRARSSRYAGVRRTEWGWEGWFTDKEGTTWTVGPYEDEFRAALDVDLANLAEHGRHGPRFNVLHRPETREFFNGAAA